jgi:hypothetical protein
MQGPTVAVQRQDVPQLVPQQLAFGAGFCASTALLSQQPAGVQQSSQQPWSQQPSSQHGSAQQAGGQHGQHSPPCGPVEPPSEAARNKGSRLWKIRFMVGSPVVGGPLLMSAAARPRAAARGNPRRRPEAAEAPFAPGFRE